jgi:hypothetical protein
MRRGSASLALAKFHRQMTPPRAGCRNKCYAMDSDRGSANCHRPHDGRMARLKELPPRIRVSLSEQVTGQFSGIPEDTASALNFNNFGTLHAHRLQFGRAEKTCANPE